MLKTNELSGLILRVFWLFFQSFFYKNMKYISKASTVNFHFQKSKMFYQLDEKPSKSCWQYAQIIKKEKKIRKAKPKIPNKNKERYFKMEKKYFKSNILNYLEPEKLVVVLY